MIGQFSKSMAELQYLILYKSWSVELIFSSMARRADMDFFINFKHIFLILQILNYD
jgi:hypothetical protein